MNRLQVAAFYAFTPLNEQQRASLLSDLPDMANTHHVLGSILVAHEGVNGTISGPESGVEALLQSLRTSLALGCEHFERLEVKRSWADQTVFRRFKARRKKEIVTMGVTSVNPRQSVGTYVDPKDWNALVDDHDTLVIDTRNSYETAIGSFEGSLDPGTESFRDFPEWAEARLRPLVNDQPPKRIAMFCTGGIRCEKASSYLQQKGFGEVHHLRGGILKYLEQVPEAESRWQGECFVFDQRLALNCPPQTTGTFTSPSVSLTVPWTAMQRQKTGNCIRFKSATSRTPESITNPAIPRACIKVASKSPKYPQSDLEFTATTMTSPGSHCSIAT